jgi:hypothetical protein
MSCCLSVGKRYLDVVRDQEASIQGIRLIKMYGWETFYIQQIAKFREKEIKTIRTSSYSHPLVRI